MKKQKITKIVALAIVIIASFVLRAYLITRNIPLYPHPDEKDFIVRTFNMIRRADFDPGWYGLPGTTFMYLLYPLFLLYFLLQIPIWDTVKTFDPHVYFDFFTNVWSKYVPNVWDAYLIARSLNAFLSVSVVVLLFILAKKIFKNFHIALLSSMLLSTAPLFLSYGSMARTDVLTIFFILLSMIVFYDAVVTESKRKLILASIFAGFAMATRFHGIVAALPIGVFALIQDFKSYKPKDLLNFVRDSVMLRTYTAIAIFFVIVAFYLATPFAVLNWKVTLKNLHFEARTTHPGSEVLPGLLNWWWYVPNVLISGAGSIFLFLSSLVGAGILIVKNFKAKKSLVLVLSFLFPIIFYAFISEANLRWARWMLPFLPYECMLAAYGLYELSKHIGEKLVFLRKYNILVFFWILGILMTAVSLKAQGNIFKNSYERSNEQLVINWINANVSNEELSHVIVEGTKNSRLQKFSTTKGISFVDVVEKRVTQEPQLFTSASYIFVIKEASKSLFCYPMPVGGSEDKGDLLCAGDILNDKKVKEALRGEYTLVTTIGKKNYKGFATEVYQRKSK